MSYRCILSSALFEVCTDLKEFEVVPHNGICPLHAWVRGDVDLERCGIILSHSGPVPLLDWQARQAFANVPMSTMRLIADDLGVELRTPDAEDMDYDAVVAMDLMIAIQPNMPHDVIEQALNDRPLKESPIYSEDIDGDTPIHWLMECASRKDSAKLKEFNKGIHIGRAFTNGICG